MPDRTDFTEDDFRRLDTVMSELIGRWCDRRALGPLRYALGGWPLFLGGTSEDRQQSWESLRMALSAIRARPFGWDVLTPEEEDLVSEAINLVDRKFFAVLGYDWLKRRR